MIALRRFLSLAQTARVSQRTDKKIVIFESDDWGSIRTPPGIIDKFTSFGLDLNRDPYHRYDILESPDDITHTLEVLHSLETEVRKKVRLTLNYVMCNPDFEKISAAHYKTYYPENFSTTYEKYWGSTIALNQVVEGIKQEYFKPQFHGREHVHVPIWLENLRAGDKVIRKAFDLGFWGISHSLYNKPERKLQATFDARHQGDLEFMKDALVDGLKKFKSVFGFWSKSLIPNNYIWPRALNLLSSDNGIKYMQGMKMLPHNWSEGKEKRKYTIRASGKPNNDNLIELVRNTAFEPAFYDDKQRELRRCLDEIQIAFLFKQPAVISTHRINFVGGLSEKNRIENLALFKKLVKSIVKKWPNVEFWDSTQLGDYFDGKIGAETGEH